MILSSGVYVPSLRWRQGEYQALFTLDAAVKDRIAPFITIPEPEFDFEEWAPKKTVHEHIHPFSARYRAKWGNRPAWIAVHEAIAGACMDDGRDVLSYIFDEIRHFEAIAIPAIPVAADAAIVSAVAGIVKSDNQGVAVSLKLEDLMAADPRARVQALADVLGVPFSDLDLIVDLGAPNFEPYAAFASAFITVLGKLGDLYGFRNLVLIGTAFPQTLKDIAKGADEIPRHDWLFYQTLLAALPAATRRPNFGDYAIVHPDFAPLDMRKFKPAGKLIYTTSSSWSVFKGGAFRDNPAQMHDHCAALLSSGAFRNSGFSKGDDYIAKCAARLVGPSNQSRWKNVAINHHITQAVDDLAKLCAVP